MILERLQKVAPEDIWMPGMMEHFFTRDDFPASLTSFRAKLPVVQNKGLALRWLAAIEEMQAYYAADCESDQAQAFVDAWRSGVLAEMEANHPAVRLFEANDTVLNITVTPPGEAAFDAVELRKVYGMLAQDIAGLLDSKGIAITAEERQLASTKCLIGQPVHICKEFSIIRLALGANNVRGMMEDLGVQAHVHTDTQILRKLSLIVSHSQALVRA